MNEFINENERLWKTKNFYKPKTKWRAKWELFVRQNPEYKCDMQERAEYKRENNRLDKKEEELRDMYPTELEEL